MRIKCHVPKCERRIEPDRLMCRPHWKHVPKAARQQLRDTYRKAPQSVHHFEAAMLCIAYAKSHDNTRDGAALFASCDERRARELDRQALRRAQARK